MTEKAEGALLRQATLPLGENINGPVDAALVVAVFGFGLTDATPCPNPAGSGRRDAVWVRGLDLP